ncbi:MAG: hypothetical protein JW797_02980 [Bradymonadales bacterium]|nr:hypothetical protein [Bradymonadales bacterium]
MRSFVRTAPAISLMLLVLGLCGSPWAWAGERLVSAPSSVSPLGPHQASHFKQAESQAASPAATTPQAGLEGLDLLPAEAALILVESSPARLSQAWDTINESLQLGLPGLAGSMDLLRNPLGLQAGLREQGPLYLFATDFQIFSGQWTGLANLFILVPITDFATFLQGFGVEQQEGSTLVPTAVGPLYARPLGQFALMGMDRQAVEALQPATPGQLSRSVGLVGMLSLNRSDLALVVNLEALEPIGRPALQQAVDAIHVQYAASDMPPESLAGTEAIMNLYVRGLDAMLRDGTRAVLGLDASQSNLGLTFTIQFAQESPMARLFTSTGGATPLLSLFPQGRYLWASTISLRGLDVASLIEALRSAMPESAGAVATMMSGVLDLMHGVQSMAQVVYFVDPALAPAGAGLFNAVSIYKVEDPQGFLDRWNQFLVGLNGLAYPIGPLADAQGQMVAGEITYNTRVERDALQVGGVPVSRYQMRTRLPEGLTDPTGIIYGMYELFGITNLTGFGAASGRYVVLTTRPDVAQLEATLALLASEAERPDDPFASLRQTALHPHQAMEYYLDVGAIASLVLALARISNPETSFEIPEGLPPVALFGDILQSGISGRMTVPFPVLSYATRLIRQAVSTLAPTGGPEPVPEPAPTPEPAPAPEP